MGSGYYAAMTGLIARSQALDTAATNLANVQTPGYRAERDFFRSARADNKTQGMLQQTGKNYATNGSILILQERASGF